MSSCPRTTGISWAFSSAAALVITAKSLAGALQPQLHTAPFPAVKPAGAGVAADWDVSTLPAAGDEESSPPRATCRRLVSSAFRPLVASPRFLHSSFSSTTFSCPMSSPLLVLIIESRIGVMQALRWAHGGLLSPGCAAHPDITARTRSCAFKLRESISVVVWGIRE